MIGQASRLIELRQLANKEKTGASAKIISVCSGKGGTGKTFFASNFAYQLSKLDKKILLIDLDLNFSNVNILLNQASENLISHFFEQSKSLDEIIFNYSSNLDLIFGDSGRVNFPRVSREVLDYFFVSLIKLYDRYDYIIIDSSAGANELLLHQVMKSDYVIFVTSPEPTAIMDSYVVLKLLEESSIDLQKFVVINKCADKEEAENSFQNLSTAVKHFLKANINYLGKISFDALVHKSIINQELLCRYYLESNASKELLAISSQFIKNNQVANSHQSTFGL